VSDIAYACGFSEVSYFNRCFRRRFGASPTQMRGS
jgi:AraC-like DNA-binding protein